MNIAAYCRVSTDKEDQLNSLEAQKLFFTEYAEKNNHNLIRTYADEGISGTKIKNRKEFLELMKDANKNIFDMVVVKDISRFARNTVDFLQSIRQLKALNIETIFLTSNQTVLGNSEFILTVFSALAQEESSNMSKRVKFGKRINAEKGRVPNIIYGYNKIIGNYFDLQANEQESDIVREIFNLYVNDGYGATKISQILNKRNLRTKRNCMWSQNAITRILKNRIYIGEVINGVSYVKDFLTGERILNEKEDWTITNNPNLQIVSKEIFLEAQKILKDRHNAFNLTSKRESNKHIFSKLIKCTHCGYSFRRTVKCYKNTYIYWHCSGRNSNGVDSCPNRTVIQEYEMIDIILKGLNNILKNKIKLKQHFINEFERYYKNTIQSISLSDLNESLDKLNRTRTKYMDMYNDDLISREELKSKMGQINIDIQNIETKINLLNSETLNKNTVIKDIDEFIKDVENVLKENVLTNEILKKIIISIEVEDKKNIKVNYKIDNILKTFV